MIAIECAQTIQVHANASVPSPCPPVAPMQMVIVIVSAIQVPVGSHIAPIAAVVALQNAETIQMPTNAFVASPEPARSLPEMSSAPQMPVRAHAAPVALVISVQSPQPIEMDANAAVAAPSPPCSTVQVVIVVIPSDQVPVTSDIVPPCTIPAPQNSQTIQMSTNPSIATPEPAGSSEVPVFLPKVPIGSHSTPMTLVVSVQSTQAVPVHTNALVSTPNPLVLAMQMVVVIVSAD